MTANLARFHSSAKLRSEKYNYVPAICKNSDFGNYYNDIFNAFNYKMSQTLC